MISIYLFLLSTKKNYIYYNKSNPIYRLSNNIIYVNDLECVAVNHVGKYLQKNYINFSKDFMNPV